MALSFPYPVLGTVKRPPGEGCLNCVHQLYCTAFYWLKRDTDKKMLDDHNGIMCASWSNNMNDQVKTVTQDDLDKNAYLNQEGVIMEADHSGMTEPTTSGYYRDDRMPFPG